MKTVRCSRANLAAVLFSMGLVACGDGGSGEGSGAGASAPAAAWQWDLPSYFPSPRVPDDNPMSAEKVDLGRYLFYDRRLSGNGTQACAGCHFQDKAFSDGRAVSRGSTGEFTPRSAQHLGNVAYNPTLTWANRSLTSLEQQMAVPLIGVNPVEMGVNDANKAGVLQRFKDLPLYQAKFKAAFAAEADPVTWVNLIKAIASFQRSLISANSRYDRARQGKTVLTEQEERGQQLFFSEKAQCSQCHGSFNFNDQVVHASTQVLDLPFNNTGLYNIGGTGAFPSPNRGLFELTGQPGDMGRFRAPSLRNVEKTAPYMHDGSIGTLEEVLDFYAAGGRNLTEGPNAGDGRLNPNKNSLVTKIRLSAQDKADLEAFLRTLTDEEFLTNPRHADPFKLP